MAEGGGEGEGVGVGEEESMGVFGGWCFGKREVGEVGVEGGSSKRLVRRDTKVRGSLC